MEAKPNFKEMSTQKKVGYVWDYYRYHILGTIVAIAILVSIVHHYATLKESVFDMMFLNAMDIEQPENLTTFFEQMGFDTETQEISVNTSMGFTISGDGYVDDPYTTQAVAAMFTVGDLDMFAAPSQIYNAYAAVGYLADLRVIFTDEELAQFEEQLVYVTLSETGEEIPCGFDLTDNAWVKESGYYSGECYFGITSNGDGSDLARDFLMYVLTY